jgi:hypothetical protein
VSNDDNSTGGFWKFIEKVTIVALESMGPRGRGSIPFCTIALAAIAISSTLVRIDPGNDALRFLQWASIIALIVGFLAMAIFVARNE